MQSNRRPQALRTHEGARAKNTTPIQALRRSVLACLLFEREFYEDGVAIADRIVDLVGSCNPQDVSDLAISARHDHGLRHVPLLLLCAMLHYNRGGHMSKLVENTIYSVVNRPDELTELLSLYWRHGKRPLAHALKRGLARAFGKFDEYQLAKYNRPKEIKLLDVMRMVHPKPVNELQANLWQRLRDGELTTPDTWEVRLSSGEEPKVQVWTDLLNRNKLGVVALLRNLRNMVESGVDLRLIAHVLQNADVSKVLPHQFVAAARYAPVQLEPWIEQAMLRCIHGLPKMDGNTILLVDVSQSMDWKLSERSDMTRADAANGLAMMLAGMCQSLRVFTFSYNLIEVPPRQGFALAQCIQHSQPHGGTYLGKAVKGVEQHVGQYDRLIVITDEQSHDPVPDPNGTGYMINVASAKNGVGYHSWLHIDGFSSAVVKYIQEFEKNF